MHFSVNIVPLSMDEFSVAPLAVLISSFCTKRLQRAARVFMKMCLSPEKYSYLILRLYIDLKLFNC